MYMDTCKTPEQSPVKYQILGALKGQSAPIPTLISSKTLWLTSETQGLRVLTFFPIATILRLSLARLYFPCQIRRITGRGQPLPVVSAILTWRLPQTQHNAWAFGRHRAMSEGCLLLAVNQGIHPTVLTCFFLDITNLPNPYDSKGNSHVSHIRDHFCFARGIRK